MIRAPMWGTSYWLEWTQYNDEYITEESLTSKKTSGDPDYAP